jgi:uncharacterized protein (TIGR00369 family)
MSARLTSAMLVSAMIRRVNGAGGMATVLHKGEPELGAILLICMEKGIVQSGALHGTAYFKMLDDAAFYAVNSMVTDRFILTTAFNILFTRPLKAGPVIAEGRWISGRKRVFVADARLIDADGDEAARGTGTFMRSRIALSALPGYRTA